MHVSILSICSFVGRLLSGVGSDILVRRLQASRTWCLTLASAIFTIAQLLALTISDPHYLFLVSSLCGLAYGFLFGVFPSIVAEVFGIHGLSTNWGFITLAPVLSGNIFNLFYGAVFDAHSVIGKDGDRVCELGLECYRNAYVVTLFSGLAALAVSLVSIQYDHACQRAAAKARELDRVA
jgi:MFS family permease